MSLQLFLNSVQSFRLSFTQKSVQDIKKVLDPFNYKYKRPYNIMNPQENPPQVKKAKPTQKVIQLSLLKLCMDFQALPKKNYMWGTFCQFYAQNIEEIQNLLRKDQSILKTILYLLLEMVRSWSIRGDFNIEVRKNQGQFSMILLSIKEYLQQYVNKKLIKNEKQRIGVSQRQTSQSPASSIKQTGQTVSTQQSSQINISAFHRIEPDQQSKPIQMQLQFQQLFTLPQIMTRVYLFLISMYCFNDKSKSAPLTASKGKSNFFIDENIEETIYFSYPSFSQTILQSVRTLFYLMSGNNEEFSLMTTLIQLASNLLVFKINAEKPVSFLRLVLFKEKKLEKKQWDLFDVSKEQQHAYYYILNEYIMLDPNFRTKFLLMIDEWINSGVDNMNLALSEHWKVLISTVNKRIFQGILQNEMFKFLIDKSQGSMKSKLHVCNLLSRMIENISPEILIRNSEQIFCLSEFLKDNKAKLLQICFDHSNSLLKKNKQVANKTMVCRVIQLYLELQNQTTIQKNEFMQFFKGLITTSVMSNEKFLTQDLLKIIHLADQQTSLQGSTQLIRESRRIISSQKDMLLLSSKIFDKNSKLLSKYYLDDQKSKEKNIQIEMLEELFDEKKKGQSYFLKFIREINKSFFTHVNLPVYEIYAEALLRMLTQNSFQNLQDSQPIKIVSNPQQFQRLVQLYQSFFEIVDKQNIFTSHELYKIMLGLQCAVERQCLSKRYTWFLRKLKYFFVESKKVTPNSTPSKALNSKGSKQLDQKIDMLSPQKQFRSNFQNTSRKSSSQVHDIKGSQNVSRNKENFARYIKTVYYCFKNKTSFLVYLCTFSLRYYQWYRKLSLNQNSLQLRKSRGSNQMYTQILELRELFQQSQYSLALSLSTISLYSIFLFADLILANQIGLEPNNRINQKEIDYSIALQNTLIQEIQKLLVLQFDYLNAYQMNQFLYMFTFKDTEGQKIAAFLGLPNGQNIPLMPKILNIMKIVKLITCKKYISLEKRSMVMSYYNHLEFSIVQFEKIQFSNIKNEEKSYTLTGQFLVNWPLKCQNFISFSTKLCKYKLIIKKNQLVLLSRKQGSNTTQKSKKQYPIKNQLRQRVFCQITVKEKQMTVFFDKKFVGTVTCESSIESVKFELINGIILRKFAIKKNRPQIHFHSSEDSTTSISFDKSYYFSEQLQIEMKLKDLSLLTFESGYNKFSYAKYYFFLKQLFKYNTELVQLRKYHHLSQVICETYLKTIQIQSLNQKQRKSQQKKSSDIFYKQKKGDEQEEMFRLLMRVMFQIYVDHKNTYCNMRKRTSTTVTKINRKYSQDVSMLKFLPRTNSADEKYASIQSVDLFEKNTEEDEFPIPILPNLKNFSKSIFSDGFVVYLLQIILKPQKWEYFSLKTQIQLSCYLKTLLSSIQFLKSVQNQTLQIFYSLLGILEKITQIQFPLKSLSFQNQDFEKIPESPLSPKIPSKPTYKNISEAIKTIIVHHKTNEMLKQKFNYFFYMAEMGKSSFVRDQFYDLLNGLVKNLLINKVNENKASSSKQLLPKENSTQDENSIGKWIFLEFQHFQFVFMNCRLDIKVKILDYLSEFQQEDKLITFLKELLPEVILGLRMWLMVYLKKMLFKLKIKVNVLKSMKFLGQVTCILLTCWSQIKQQSQKQQLMKILREQIAYISQRQKQKQVISPELLHILSQQEFLRFLIILIDDFLLNPTKCDPQIHKFTQSVFEVIFDLEKRQLIEVLTSYRRFCNKNVGLLSYPLKLQTIKRLKIYQMNCFLQYIIQCQLSIQNSISEEQTSYFAITLKNFLQVLFKQWCNEPKDLDNGLLYAYPKIYHLFNCSQKKQIEEKLNKINKQNFKQLRGGIYFKLMIITAHLIEIKPDQDVSHIVQELIFKSSLFEQKQQGKTGQKMLHAAYRAINDFSEVQSLTKQRSYSQKLINLTSKSHKAYCLEFDQPYDPLEVVSTKLLKFQEQNDLTPFIVDYFIMKLIVYLEWQEETPSDLHLDQINKKYSNIILKAFEKYPMIYNDISEKNVSANVCVNDYSELLMLMAGEDMLLTQKVMSPSRYELQFQVSSFPQTPQKDYLDQSELERLQTQSPSKSKKNIQLYESERFSKTANKKEDQFLNPQNYMNPKKVPSRKKSFHIFDIQKNKDYLVEEIKKNHRNWRTKCLKKQFNKFFRDEAKQLLIIELLFTYFVQNTIIKPRSQIINKSNKTIQKYFQNFEEQLEKYEDLKSRNHLHTKQLIRLFNLKRIMPYFMQKQPILKVKACGFPNMCMPVLTKIPKQNYNLRKQPNFYMQSFVGEELTMDMFGIDKNDFDLQQEATPTFSNDHELSLSYKPPKQTNLVTTPKKTVYEGSEKSFRQKSYICLQQSEFQLQMNQQKKQINYCELVTRKGVFFCQWNIVSREQQSHNLKEGKKLKGQNILVLQSFKSKPSDCPRMLKYGSPLPNILFTQKTISIPVSSIREVFYRKFNQIRNNSIELFCNDGRSHFICLYCQEKADKLVKGLTTRKNLKVVKSPEKQFEKKQYTLKWVNGQIDNFTYLMLINKYSGRSFCDTNQYPVFPWVIADYKSKVLRLDDIKTYRDLTKPIGALNQEKLRRFYEKYNLQNEDTGIFLYGSHFSTSLFVYYFLVRMEPFSSLHQQMQGGQWDAPDRLFSSMQHMWESLMSPSSSTDIKQAIPEFYYFPFFLMNTNHIDLGIRQSGELVNDVILPAWAKSAQDFIFKMRSALQSNYVSLNLPYWIDMIFGIDQKNIRRHNLYHPLSYSQNIHIDKIPQKDLQARMCQINFFGQHPIKIFHKAHRLKKLAITSIFASNILTSNFIRSSSTGKKQNNDMQMLNGSQNYSFTAIQKSSRSQNSLICVLKMKHHIFDTEFEVEFDPKIESIENISKKIQGSIKDLQKGNRRRRQSQNSNKALSQRPYSHVPKIQCDPCYIGYIEPRISNILSSIKGNLLKFYLNSNQKQILTSFYTSKNYSHHFYCQSFIVLYGQDGFCLLNWNNEVVYEYGKRAIDCCFIDEMICFIGSKDGKIYIFDMVGQEMTLIFDLGIQINRGQVVQKVIKTEKDIKVQSKQKESKKQPKPYKIYDLKMQIFTEKKLISTFSQVQYRIVCVANQKRVYFLNYRHAKKNWVCIDKD